MYYSMYITYCCILTILICTTDAVNICPSRTILVSTSGTIESPAYPNEYWSALDCTLNLLVPSQTNIEFRVDGEYDYNVNHYQGRCRDNNNHFRLVTPDGITQLCGKRADNEVLGSYYNSGESNATITLQFITEKSTFKGYRFKIEYTGLAATTTSTTTTSTTSTTTTSPSTNTTTTTEPFATTVLSTTTSCTTITAISHADSTASTDFSQTRNLLIGSGVALVIIIVVIVSAVMFRRRQQTSRNNPVVLSTDVIELNSTTSDYINVDGHMQISNCGTGEGAVSTNQYASLDLLSRETDDRTYAELSLYQNV